MNKSAPYTERYKESGTYLISISGEYKAKASISQEISHEVILDGEGKTISVQYSRNKVEATIVSGGVTHFCEYELEKSEPLVPFTLINRCSVENNIPNLNLPPIREPQEEISDNLRMPMQFFNPDNL